MTVPVTTRLDREILAALDQAVTAGLGPNRAAIIAAAVGEWLARHGEEGVVASYRRRYQEPDASHDEVVARLSAFSVAACLAASEA
ncbi:MAG: ribbon-helix-helix domain-containing protein [Acidimicrobiia bacterium]